MELKQLKFNRNKILTDMQELARKPWTNESRAAFDKMTKEVETLDGDILRAEQVAAYYSESRSFERSPRPAVGAVDNGTQQEQRSKYNAAFRAYALHGQAGLNAEQRDMLTTSDVTGGALIPQMFDASLTTALKYYGPIAQKVKQKVTDNNGAPIKISLANDTANGLTLLGTEGTSAPAETDPAVQSKVLSVDTVTGGLVKVSFQELSDSSFDLDNLIRDFFGKRYGRGVETAITTGKDSAGTVLPNQNAGGLLAAATAGTTTAALANGIGWDDLTAVYGSLDPAYVINPNWVMNSSTRSYLIGLKDGFGRPFFDNDPSGAAPFSKIMGYDIVLDQAMPNMGASAVPILFGDLENAYMLRTDGAPSILRLNERYADTLEVGFYLFTRIGGISLNAGISPLVKLTQSAT